MSPDTVLDIVTAAKPNAFHWTPKTVTWGEVQRWLDKPASRKECGGYVFGVLRETTQTHRADEPPCTDYHRINLGVESRSALVLDVDHPAEGFADTLDIVLPSAHVGHTTFNSTPQEPRYRLIIPTDRLMAPDEYHAVADAVMAKLGVDQFDRGSREPARQMFRPSAQKPEWFESWVADGEPLNVDELLADFVVDLSTLPVPKTSSTKRDPQSLEGVVGAFNRVYDIGEVIEAYDLPYVTAGANWQLVGARSIAGLKLVDDTGTLAYSHHVTDPAHGRAVSPFDLVRLHRFGELDAGKPEQTPINRLPSHTAMQELASTDVRVVAELVGADFAGEVGDALDVVDWRLGLQLHRRTGDVQDVIKNWDLIVANEPLFKLLQFNELSMAVEVSGDLPWRPLERGGATFSATDRAALCHHIERNFQGLRPSRTLMDELVNTTAAQRYVNPLRDYLLAREGTWDGEARVEESLPGVVPTPYTRMVARKALVAAVARVMEPGVKWDHTVVLFGGEGKGKSWWVDRVFRGYASTLGDIHHKDTLLIMQRSWVMLADEGYSLRKANADAQKEFLTRRVDVFRAPFERETMAHPRHCVIWSTTNDEVFLRRQEGNRRFLIVRSENRVDFDALTDEYVDQLWAEAVHLYRAGEKLWLDEDQSRVAADERETFTEEDAKAGAVEDYLEMLVPESWDEMSPEARVTFRANRAEELGAVGTVQMTEVCSAQIWVEVFGRRLGDHSRTELLELNNIMRKLPGWSVLPGRRRVPHYGPQQVFVREMPEDIL